MANVEKLRKNLEAHGFETSCFATGKEAADYLCSRLSGRTIGFGGSCTADELDLYPRLSENNKVIWHWKQGGQVRREASQAEVCITSANGVSETGELVNIDGAGNRVAATLYGPEKVYFIIGINKIEPTLEKAIERARNVASPLNSKRLNMKTPCALSAEARCYDCSSPDRICSALVVHWRAMSGIPSTEVVIVEESLGY